MGLDVFVYKKSKLDPRYKMIIGEFSKVYFVENYFRDETSDVITVSQEKFVQFVNDLKMELGGHKGVHLPLGFDSDLVEPNNDLLRDGSDYGSVFWMDVRRLYRWGCEVLKSIDWEKDELLIYFW